jgi:PAS domain S-box-containing protein
MTDKYDATMMAHCPDILIYHTLEWQCLSVSPACQTLLGYTPQAFKNYSLYELVHPQDQTRMQRFYKTLLEQPSRDILSHRWRSHDQNYDWFESSSQLVVEDTAAETKIVTLSRYVPEHRRLEKACQNYAEYADVARLIAIGETTANIAHELNQPLAAIVNYVGGCLRRLEKSHCNSKEVYSALEQARAQAEHAGKIVHGLRNLLKKRELQLSVVQINSLIHTILNLIEFQIHNDEVTVQLQLAESLPSVVADADQLEQVLLNLVRNALESMRHHEQRDLIIVSSYLQETQEIKVEITDSGRGFSEETAEKMFNPFFTTKTEGMGIGLSISRSIMKAHQGRLDAISHREGGATFCFTLPINHNAH